jgi:wobble nucleotide-excising tRNase
VTDFATLVTHRVWGRAQKARFFMFLLSWGGAFKAMIEKFVSIKNIGRFRSCSPSGDVAFRKLTLLFAENGQGKTTLCAILRSLQSGRQEFISERKTLGVSAPSSVQLRLGGNTVSFSNNAWSVTHPDIAIFDSIFIHENVYAGDYVEHEHKKNLYRVIVGEQGVRLARQIDDLDAKIRDASSDIRDKKDAASKPLPNAVTLDAYLAWQPIEDVDNKIQLKTTEITNRQRTLEKATEIQSKSLLAKVQLPSFPSDFLAILSKQITDITADQKRGSGSKLPAITWRTRVSRGSPKAWDISQTISVPFVDKA